LATYNLCGGTEQKCSYFCGDKGDFTAWIDYQSAEETLEVRFVKGCFGVGRPTDATFTVNNLRLNEVLDEYMYVGFSASTGGTPELHRVSSWEFNSTMLNLPTRAPSPGSRPERRRVLISEMVVVSIVAVAAVLVVGLFIGRSWRRASSNNKFGLVDPNLALHKFTYKELSKATKNFNRSEFLGSGGFGAVYKGTLPSGAVVAVKRMRMESNDGKESFQAEVTSLSQIRHRNLVQLLGWCHEEEQLLLVYDYMSHGSLNKWLFHFPERNGTGTRQYEALPLTLRHSVLSGVATALSYLQEECAQCVLHRDIKSSNVLLDGDWNAYLGDFGLARVIDHQKMEKTTVMAGTLGYMAPEMPHTGKATKESDVYSFGVLMLEVMCRMRPLDTTAIELGEGILVNRVWRAHEAGNILELADSRLASFPPPSAAMHVES
jgi:hypothetical protein